MNEKENRTPLTIGMRPLPFMRMVMKNRRYVDRDRWVDVAKNMISAMTIGQAIGMIAHVKTKKAVDAQRVIDPIFIIGHWRSGTTLLHEFFSLDPDHIYPNTFECFAPDHFLMLENRFAKNIERKKRAMDDVEVGYDTPQEDEFALMNMGMPSPLERIVFPAMPIIPNVDWITLESLPEESRKQWLGTLLLFCKRLTFYKDQALEKRLVLKTPAHMARIRFLKQLFPQSKFIFISRSPYDVVPSAIKTQLALSEKHGFSKMPELNKRRMFDEAIESYDFMHKAYEHGLRHVDAQRDVMEIRFEDLIEHPMSTMAACYAFLEKDFFPVEKIFEEKAKRVKPSSRYDMTSAQRRMIRDRLKPWFERFQRSP